MKNFLLTVILLSATAASSFSQDSLRVLFLGNSYTNFNNLPGLTSSMAEAEGNYIYTESNTPGGYTLNQHSTGTTSLNLIAGGGWDYVVLQEQSQIPTIEYLRDNYMYPGASSLKESILEHNPCAKIVMYMTWGRQYGGMQCTSDGVFCSVDFEDFSHMTDTLATAYENVAESIGAQVAPVGKAWDHALTYSTTDPALVLHATDQSHPNYSGSYLAACVFHGIFWNESPVGNTFTGSLNESEASYLQNSALVTLEEYHEMNTSNTSSVYGAYGSTFGTECELDSDENSLFFNPPSENFTYTWHGNIGLEEGETNTTLTPLFSGDYYITVTSENGCESTCSGFFAVGIEEESIENWKWVNSNTLLASTTDNYTVEIFNYSGKLVYNNHLNANEITIPPLEHGVYLIKIANKESRVELFKFIR